jgi:hypothetical protein
MPDFTIRSLQFKNANTVNFTNSANFTLLGVNTDSTEFTRINPDLLFDNKLRNGEGIVFTKDSVNKYTTISRDYTTEELQKLNLIDIYLQKIVASCTYSGCVGGCIASAAAPNMCEGNCTSGCRMSSVGATTCTLSSCVSSCMATSAL